MATTTILYDRKFNVATAKRGDLVDVTFKVNFISPLVPSVNCWFDNVGDNLGGSKSTNGPLVWDSIVSTTSQNLNPPSAVAHAIGETGAKGCFRFWAQGGVYPSPITPFSTDIWRPVNASDLTVLTVVQRFRVHSNATIGLVIGAPTRATPCSDTNFDADKLMIDLGSECNLLIKSDQPSSGSRTLTIVE